MNIPIGYRGNIRELVADTLKKAKVPLHIDVIMEKVLQEYPHTTKKNVVTSINKDEARFVLYDNGIYGLVGRNYGKKFVALKTEHYNLPPKNSPC